MRRRTWIGIGLAAVIAPAVLLLGGSPASGVTVGYVSVNAATMKSIATSSHNEACDPPVIQVEGEEFQGVLYQASGSFLAAVDLPNGATITSLRYVFHDNTDPGDTHALLVRKQQVSGINFTTGYLVLAEAHSSGAGSLTRKVTDTSVTNPTVDNESYSYYVEVVNCDTTIEPLGVRIAYTTP